MSSGVTNFDVFMPRPSTKLFFFAGLASSYPDINTSDGPPLASRLSCEHLSLPGCKVFHVPTNDIAAAVELDLDDAVAAKLANQVLIFRFRNKFYAIDHTCPHSSHPLSKGTVFDIEDFGLRLSAGIRCSKHDWSFDLVRGNGDRGNYRLKVWETQLRPVTTCQQTAAETNEQAATQSSEQPRAQIREQEVWVRPKQRIG